MALVSALLLLLVLTILGVGMFRSFGLQERIAGNTRERQRSLHAAETAESYAEWWLTTSRGVNATSGVSCSTLTSASSTPQVCSNVIANPLTVPYTVGSSYTPPGMTVGSAGALDNYYASPAFYISFLSGFYDKTSGTQVNNYQVDATSYAGNNTSVVVVESAFTVNVTATAQTRNQKFVSLGGP